MKYKKTLRLAVFILLIFFFNNYARGQKNLSFNLSGGPFFTSGELGSSFMASVDKIIIPKWGIRLAEEQIISYAIYTSDYNNSFSNYSLSLFTLAVDNKYLRLLIGLQGGVSHHRIHQQTSLGEDIWTQAPIAGWAKLEQKTPFFGLWLQNNISVNKNFYFLQYLGYDQMPERPLLLVRVGLGINFNK